MAKSQDRIYKDDEYEIYKKDAEVVGTMLASLDIVGIGIDGIKDENPSQHFANKDDYNKIIDSMISDLGGLKVNG